ncbi:hypothetical protein C8R44DRAFT_782701 [Mycena epipterygia]|nr:hypothetical protein C8R44DRAFT_782701 [Mycena epipterygia]
MAQKTIDTLPHELLGELFTQCAAISPDAPIVLGAVTRLFRHIVYSTPSAWGNLNLSDTDGPRKAALWFEMSKACHIEVQIQMAQTGGRTEHGSEAAAGAVNVPVALATLRFHTDRIASLSLRTDTQAQARAALATIYPNANRTALRSLRISAASASASAAPGLLQAFPAIPGITELETTNVALGALPSLDLERLQSLHIVQPLLSAPLAADDILDLMPFAPRLTRLRVEARVTELATAATDEPRFMPQLEELHLRANNLVALLDRLIAPALHVLHLSDLDGKRPGASSDMGAALHRLLVRMELGKGDVKSNELRVLELVGVEVERRNAVWERCTQRMKALEVFSVDSPEEKGWPVQDDIVGVGACAEVGSRPMIKAGFSFGFGAPPPLDETRRS